MIRRLVAAAFVLAACALALVLTGATEDPRGTSYRVVFDNVFGLTEGGDLKIGGVKAGETTGFELTDDEPHKVAVEILLTEPGLTGLREDARCAVRQQSLIGEYYVDCQPGTGELLPEGGTVPVEQTSSTIPIDLVSNVMRLPYRERFRLIINELGVGLAGRPDDLSEVIRRAHPGLRETSRTLEILADQNREIEQFIASSDAVARRVEPRRRDLSRWADEASRTATVQASRADSLEQQWARLPVFLAELQPTLAQLDATARRQIPTLEQLGDTAPELDRFLEAAEPFADAGKRSNAELAADRARGPARARREQGGGPQAARPGSGRAEAGSAAAPAPRVDRRPPPLDRERPECGGAGPARARQDRLARRARNDGHGGVLELRLRPGPGDQLLRRGRPPPADRPAARYPLLAPLGRSDRGRPGALRLVPRPLPAGPRERQGRDRALRFRQGRQGPDRGPRAQGGGRVAQGPSAARAGPSGFGGAVSAGAAADAPAASEEPGAPAEKGKLDLPLLDRVLDTVRGSREQDDGAGADKGGNGGLDPLLDFLLSP